MAAHDDDRGQAPAPWHHSTANVVGASVAALAVIGLVIWGISAMVGTDQPQDAPINFVNPSYASTTSARSTTSTVTTTRTPITSEVMGPPENSGSETSPSDTTSETTDTSTTTTSTWTSHELPTTRTHASESDDTATSRNRPRQNVTRTVYPGN